MNKIIINRMILNHHVVQRNLIHQIYSFVMMNVKIKIHLNPKTYYKVKKLWIYKKINMTFYQGATFSNSWHRSSILNSISTKMSSLIFFSLSFDSLPHYAKLHSTPTTPLFQTPQLSTKHFSTQNDTNKVNSILPNLSQP